MSKPKHFSGECPKVVSGSNKIVRNTARTEPSEAFEESNFLPSPVLLESSALLWNGAWDSHGVYVYQAFNDTIADYAVEHQTFSGKASRNVLARAPVNFRQSEFASM